jgi:hypothetical protein
VSNAVSNASSHRGRLTFPFPRIFQHHKRSFNETVRGQYINDKLRIDSHVLAHFAARELTIRPHEETAPKKVAFLFLLMDTLSQPDVWGKFFAAADPDHYSIYTHRALRPDVKDPPPPLDTWNGTAVRWVNSTWCALLGVEMALLESALEDSNNEQFVFVSHDAVPVKSFGYIHRQLAVNSPSKSKFCFAEPAKHQRALLEQFENEMHGRCVFRDFYRTHQPRTVKHHEWIVLSRPHAAIVTRRAQEGHRIWAESWRQAAPDISTGEGCSDESVPATSLLYDAELRGVSEGDPWEDLERMGVEQQCLTFVHWYHCLSDTVFSLPTQGLLRALKDRSTELWRYFFDGSFDFIRDTTLNGFPTSYEIIDAEHLKQLTRQGFMFARKFPDNAVVVSGYGVTATRVHVSAYLPTLWAEVDEESARNRVWTRMETIGQPGRIAE